MKESKLGNRFFSHRGPCSKIPFIKGKLPIDSLESQGHQDFKRLMVNFYRKYGLIASSEHYLSATNQYADILVEHDGFHWVIEYQKSIISSQQISQRHKAYKTYGYEVVWLVSANIFQGIEMKQFHKNTVNYRQKLGLFWLFWDENSQSLYYYQGTLISPKQAMKIKDAVRITPMHLLKLEAIKGNRPLTSWDYVSLPSQRKRLRTIQAILNAKTYRWYLNNLYKRGIHLLDLPDWVFIDMTILIMDSPIWLYWAYVCNHIQKNQAGKINQKQLIEVIQDLLSMACIKLAPLPLVEEDLVENLVRESLEFLSYQGILSKETDGLYYLKRD